MRRPRSAGSDLAVKWVAENWDVVFCVSAIVAALVFSPGAHPGDATVFDRFVDLVFGDRNG